MSERLITLLCALGALALFYAIFLSPPESVEERVSQPTTEERGNNGYAGAMHWLSSAGVRVESMRQRYDALSADREGATRGNLLITSLPHRYGMRERELQELWAWVAFGNTVLVLAALADTPDWTMPLVERDLPRDVRELTGVHFEVPDVEAELDAQTLADTFKRLIEPKRHRIVRNRPHPLFEGVREVRAESEFPASEWRAQPPHGDFVLSLAHDADNGRDAFWVRRYGNGRFLISGYGSLFSNEQLGEKDNARLLANIVSQSLGPGGAVLFDDQHQGLSELYDAEAFFADERLHATLWLLFAAWLIWILGSVRLRGAPQPPPAPRETAFVQATGGFLARVLHPVQAGRRLIELFFGELRRQIGLGDDDRLVWNWLERQPNVSRADLDSLRAVDARLRTGGRIDLERLQNLLRKLQGQI
jgi:Domain of unknown function (DUF4350)